MIWNPLTATLATWIVSIPASHWALRQMRARTRNPWARRYYLSSSMASCAFAIWAVVLGGWWFAWLAVEFVSMAMTTDAATKVNDGEVASWAR